MDLRTLNLQAEVLHPVTLTHKRVESESAEPRGIEVPKISTSSPRAIC